MHRQLFEAKPWLQRQRAVGLLGARCWVQVASGGSERASLLGGGWSVGAMWRAWLLHFGGRALRGKL